MFWVQRVVVDSGLYPVGVPHDPADNEMVEVIRDRTNRYSLVPNAHVNRPDTQKEVNVRLSIGTRQI